VEILLQESSGQKAKRMVEQLEAYKREVKETKTQHKALEDRLRLYEQEKSQWQLDCEKLKEVTARLEEVESKTKDKTLVPPGL
jgi:regulator of replication initiation timing